MIKIKEFLNNEKEDSINEWLDKNVKEEDFIDIKTASVIDENGKIKDRIVVVYKYDPKTATLEVE